VLGTLYNTPGVMLFTDYLAYLTTLIMTWAYSHDNRLSQLLTAEGMGYNSEKRWYECRWRVGLS